jgi:hypothetical protein
MISAPVSSNALTSRLKRYFVGGQVRAENLRENMSVWNMSGWPDPPQFSSSWPTAHPSIKLAKTIPISPSRPTLAIATQRACQSEPLSTVSWPAHRHSASTSNHPDHSATTYHQVGDTSTYRIAHRLPGLNRRLCLPVERRPLVWRARGGAAVDAVRAIGETLRGSLLCPRARVWVACIGYVLA